MGRFPVGGESLHSCSKPTVYPIFFCGWRVCEALNVFTGFQSTLHSRFLYTSRIGAMTSLSLRLFMRPPRVSAGRIGPVDQKTSYAVALRDEQGQRALCQAPSGAQAPSRFPEA